MDGTGAKDENVGKLANRKVYYLEMDGSEPDITLAKVHLSPHSFVEFASETDAPVLMWDGGFGIIVAGIFYWTEMSGIKTLSDLVKFYKVSGKYMDSLSPEKYVGIKKILDALELPDLATLLSMMEDIDYALKLGIIRIVSAGSEIGDAEDLKDEIFGYGNLDSLEVIVALPLKDIRRCRIAKIGTYDECILKMKYDMSLEDYDILLHIDPLVKDLGEWKRYDKPEIQDSRVVIGERGYNDPVYLGDMFPAMDRFRNTLADFKKLYRDKKVHNYAEYILLKKRQYSVEDLKSMIQEGLVRVKTNGEYHKIISVSAQNSEIILVDEDKNEYSLTDVLSKGSIIMPLSGNYHSYRSSKNKYYVEWKMLRNVRNDDNRAPKSIEELKKLVSLGLVKIHGKEAKEIIIKGREIYVKLEDVTILEFYPIVSSRNEFEILGPLKWIRRFIAEGFGERDAIRLVLTIKEFELAKKDSIPLSELTNRTGIPINRLEIYLTSDRFKRFGELRKDTFRLHPDIEEFKNSVKVRRGEDIQYIVVDGRNVMYGGEEKEKKKGKVGNIITVIESLKKRGIPADRIKVIVKNADFNKNRVDNLEKLRELESKGVIQPVSYGYDDMEILKIALEELNALIITTDKYGEFVGGNITQEDLDERRIEYTFRGKQFHIRKAYLPKLEKLIEKFRSQE